jgi:hypothetical protein
MKKLLCLLILLMVSGCETFDPTIPWFDKVRPNTLSDDVDPAYKQGFDDGCESGYAVYGNHMYKTVHGFRRDSAMVGTYGYDTAWYDGYNYCRQSANTLTNEGPL